MSSVPDFCRFSFIFLGSILALCQGDYVFVADPDLVWVLNHGRTQSFGKLDNHGSFVPIEGWANIDPTRLESVIFRFGFLNPARSVGRPENVYEFRSGRLIPGTLDEEGHFIPEIDGKIIPFKDYKYVPNKSRRIYNLPGKFVPKK